MAEFEIRSCSIEDGPALAKVYVSAFWTDLTWVVIWRGKTLEYVIAQSGRRWPYTLLMNRANRRHQKVLDAETGSVVGYARWTLPELDINLLNNSSVWPDAQVPAVAPDREQEAKADYAGADYNYDRSLDELDRPLDAMMERLKSEKPHVGKEIAYQFHVGLVLIILYWQFWMSWQFIPTIGGEELQRCC
jgi:hypothetical protein